MKLHLIALCVTLVMTADAVATNFEITDILPADFTNHIAENTGAFSEIDGVDALDKESTASGTTLVDVAIVYETLRSGVHAVTINTSDITNTSANGPYLGAVGFFNSQTNGFAFWAAASASDGTLLPFEANDFTFDLGGAGTYALVSSNYDGQYDTVLIDFFFDAPGDRLALDALESKGTPIPTVGVGGPVLNLALALMFAGMGIVALRRRIRAVSFMAALFLCAATSAHALATLSIDNVSLSEANAAGSGLVFTVTRSDNLTDVSVRYDTSDLTATAGEDYVSVTGGTVNFVTGGPLTMPINITAFDDQVHERSESFSVTLSSPVGADLGPIPSDATGQGTLLNDDNAQVNLSDISLAEGNGPGNTAFVFTLTLSLAVDHSVEFSYFTGDATATTADLDYVSKTSTVLFAGNAGEQQQITIDVNSDRKEESDEYFNLLFGSTPNDGGRGVTISPASVRATILDDDIDTDRDGLSDTEEASLGTNPTNKDSDGDGIEDGTEVRLGRDPRVDEGADNTDTDGDGIPDVDEVNIGLDPNNPDEDSDGYLDGYEIAVNGRISGGIFLGDADGDGDLDFDDVRLLLQQALNGAPLVSRSTDSDLNRDGIVDRTDAMLLLYRLRGINQNLLPFPTPSPGN